MKLLPAALLTLLSAASSILPSVAAEKESASGVGVARKLVAKSVKGADCDDDQWWDDPRCFTFWVEQEKKKFQALYFARGTFCISDKNDDGEISGEDEVAALRFSLGVQDENIMIPYTVEGIAEWVTPRFLTANDEQVTAMNEALGGLVAITAGCRA